MCYRKKKKKWRRMASDHQGRTTVTSFQTTNPQNSYWPLWCKNLRESYIVLKSEGFLLILSLKPFWWRLFDANPAHVSNVSIVDMHHHHHHHCLVIILLYLNYYYYYHHHHHHYHHHLSTGGWDRWGLWHVWERRKMHKGFWWENLKGRTNWIS